jgi:hypothetical protein
MSLLWVLVVVYIFIRKVIGIPRFLRLLEGLFNQGKNNQGVVSLENLKEILSGEVKKRKQSSDFGRIDGYNSSPTSPPIAPRSSNQSFWSRCSKDDRFKR